MTKTNSNGRPSGALSSPDEAIRTEAAFLLDRLHEINLDDDTDDLIRDWNGHVEPSIARLRGLIASPPPQTQMVAGTAHERIARIIGDYVDLSDSRYSQMMDYVLDEVPEQSSDPHVVGMDEEDRTPVPTGYDAEQWRKADEVHHATALVADDAACVGIIYEALSSQRLEIAKLRQALEDILLYANDTLSGRADGGPDDRAWQREAVIECRNRARAALSAPEAEG